MTRCTVCREKVYRNFQEHVLMHVRAARGSQPRFASPATAYASVASASEPIGVGTEIRPLQRPGFFTRIGQSIRRFLGLGS